MTPALDPRWRALLARILDEGEARPVHELHTLAKATLGWPLSPRPSQSDLRLAGVVRELARTVADSPASRRAVLGPLLKALAIELAGSCVTPDELAARPGGHWWNRED